MADTKLNTIMLDRGINALSVKDNNAVRQINTTELVKVREVIDKTIDETNKIWKEHKTNKESNLWMTVLLIVNKTINAVENLDKMGLKGGNKKAIAMTIIETVIDEKDINIKVMGIPVPFIKSFIKKYVMKYADQLIDWIIAHVFNGDKS